MKTNKKILATLLSFALVVSGICGCDDSVTSPSNESGTSGTEISGGETSETPSVERPTAEETRALAMVDTIFRQYGVSGGVGEDAYINLKEYHNQTQSGYLWSNFCGIGMQYYVCKLYPDSEEEKDTFKKMINNLKYFRQSNPASNSAENSVKYHSARGNTVNGGYGDCFFDDNIWVARNFLRAYEIFGDGWYLEEAIRVNNWVISGWNNELGGLVWSEVGLSNNATEQHLERGLSANACGIMVNAMLAGYVEDTTEKAYYTEWAEKFYTFCKKMQNLPESYDYWNGIHTVIVNGKREDGTVNRVHYSYNSGSMILADLYMYELTDDQTGKDAYMDDAINTAAAAKKTFNMFDPGNLTYYYSGDPWFAAILNEAYYELLKYDKNLALDYLKSFDTNVKNAYRNRDPMTGLCPYQATETVSWNRNESYVIHQVGFAEQAVISALYSLEK